MPSASTSATDVATGGSTATGCTAAGTVTGAGATGVEAVVGVDAVEIAGRGSDVVGVVVVAGAAFVVVASTAFVVAFGAVRAGSGLADGTVEARWGRTAITVPTARVEAKQTRTSRTGRRLTNEEVLLIPRVMPPTRSVADALTGRGEDGGALSTMC
jgi:hypothetical protein